jgi:hypothetical protein
MQVHTTHHPHAASPERTAHTMTSAMARVFHPVEAVANSRTLTLYSTPIVSTITTRCTHLSIFSHNPSRSLLHSATHIQHLFHQVQVTCHGPDPAQIYQGCVEKVFPSLHAYVRASVVSQLDTS